MAKIGHDEAPFFDSLDVLDPLRSSCVHHYRKNSIIDHYPVSMTLSLVLKLLFAVVLVQLELRLWLQLLDLHHKRKQRLKWPVPVNDKVPAVEIHLITK